MATYSELKELHPEMVNCFFAFSNSQFAEGMAKHNLEGQKIYSGGAGLYGTDEGIKNFLSFYGKLADRIKEECKPQEVYDYEFGNHECEYVGDDREAYEMVVDYFGAERVAKEVQRRYAWVS